MSPRLALISSFAALSCAVATGCPSSNLPPLPPVEANPPPRAVKNVTLGDVGLEAAAMDPKADPCSDFYRYACGKWVENTQIPADQSRWMRSFSEIQQRNEKDLREILEQLAAKADAPADKQLGDFYASCVDQDVVDKQGLGEVEGLLARARDVAKQRGVLDSALAAAAPKPEPAKPKKPGPKPAANHFPNNHPPPQPPNQGAPQRDATAPSPAVIPEALESFVAELHRRGIFPFFDISSGPDDKDATTNIAQMDQNGLGLPDRDYYFDEKFADVRDFYRGHVARMLVLGGVAEAESQQAADDVIKVEKAIAQISKTRVERRDPQGMYNKIDRNGLQERGRNGFDFPAYLDALVGRAQNKALGVKPFTAINVTSVPFFEKIGEVASSASAPELYHYLVWHILHASAEALPKSFDAENFALGQKITGQKEQKPRWKRCVAFADGALGESLGQAYVQKRFSPEAKEAVRTMLMAIRGELDHRFPKLDWMDSQTRDQAIAKLAKMEYLVGYPEKWRQYPFAVDRAHLGDNMLRANAYELERRLAKVEQPVDRGEWLMTPQTVNAYYDPNKNHMVFPAGILQTPFFDPKASLAVNMGSIGMVVGHEMTHGFDDQGSQYDGAGNLKSWWQPAVRKKFDDQAGCISEQYGAYEVLPGVKQNGKLTLGENIADNAGVMLAYRALESLRKDAPEMLVADGFDERQQFFLAVGQVWCSKYTDEIAKLRAAVDPHSNPRWRVNGSLRNLPAFADAFGCKLGSTMRPEKTCAVW